MGHSRHIKFAVVLAATLAAGVLGQPSFNVPNSQQPSLMVSGASNLRVTGMSPDGVEGVLTFDYSYDGIGGGAARILAVVDQRATKGSSAWFGCDPAGISKGQGTLSLKVRFFNDETGVPDTLVSDRVRLLLLDDTQTRVLGSTPFLKSISWGKPGAKAGLPRQLAAARTSPPAAEAKATADALEQRRQASLEEKQQEEARLKAEAEIKRLAEEKALAEAKARAQALEREKQAALQLQREEEARIKAEAEIKRLAEVKALAEAKAKTEALERERQAELEAKRQEEARIKAEAEVKRLAEEKALAEAKAKAEALDRARQAALEAKRQEEARLKAEAEFKRLTEEKAIAEAKAKAEAAEKQRLADAEVKQQEELRLKAEAEAKAKADEKALADAKAKAEALELARQAAFEARVMEKIRLKLEADEKRLADEKALAEAKAKAETLERERQTARENQLAEEKRLKNEAEARRLADEKALSEAKARAEALEKERKAAAEAAAKSEARLKEEENARRLTAEKPVESAPVASTLVPSGPSTLVDLEISPTAKSKVTNVDVVNRSLDRTRMTIGVEYEYKDDFGPKALLGVDVLRVGKPEVRGYFNSKPIEVGRNRRNFMLFPVKFEPPQNLSDGEQFSTDKVLVYLEDTAAAKRHNLYPATMLLAWRAPGATMASANGAPGPLEMEDFKQSDPASGYVTVKYNLASPTGTIRVKVFEASHPETASYFEPATAKIRSGRGQQIIDVKVDAGAKSPTAYIKADTIEVELLDASGAVTSKLTRKVPMAWSKPQP